MSTSEPELSGSADSERDVPTPVSDERAPYATGDMYPHDEEDELSAEEEEEDPREGSEEAEGDHNSSDDTPAFTSDTNAAAAAAAKAERDVDAVAADTGMRREWNFTLTFLHKQARVVLQCSPQWEPTFIDPDLIDRVRHLDRDVRHTPLIPCLRYTDFSAVVGAAPRGGRHTGTRSSTGARLSGTTNGDDESGAAPAASAGAADHSEDGVGSNDPFRSSYAEAPGDWWLEKAKHVEMLYSHLPPDMTLERYCKDCVHHVLKDPQIVSVDQEVDRSHLHVGRKLDCPYRLGGHRSFHFRCRLQNRAQLIDDSVYAIGTVVAQRGYLVLIRCAEEEELEGYLARLFLPTFTAQTAAVQPLSASGLKLQLDADVTYNEVTSIVLSEQQERYGELRYVDRDAAISFSLPMHPMRIRPDFSPAKTVGVGSIACMTIEVNVYERLIDDTAVAELSGMPRFKINQVVLCLDVEDVARMGYPRVISTEAYSRLKTERLMDVFADSKSVGQPTTVPVGGRVGRSRTTTFTYEPLQGLVKNMNVSTLVAHHGVTVLYLTRLGGGAFDTHLYLFQQLLASVIYHPIESGAGGGDAQSQRLRSPERAVATGAIKDRLRIPNTRLLEPDLPRAYARGCAAAAAEASREVEAAIAGALFNGTAAPPGAAETRLLGPGGTTAAVTPTGGPASANGGPLKDMGSSTASGRGGASTASADATSPLSVASPSTPATVALTPAAQAMLQQHVSLLRLSNDGRVDGPTIVVNVPLNEGGTAGGEGTRDKHDRHSGSPQDGDENDHENAEEEEEGSAGPAGSSDAENNENSEDPTKAAAAGEHPARSSHTRSHNNDENDDDDVKNLSLHSQSLISVSSITHLRNTDDMDGGHGVTTTTTNIPDLAATTGGSNEGGADDDARDPFADVTPLQLRPSRDSELTSVPRRDSNTARRVSRITITGISAVDSEEAHGASHSVPPQSEAGGQQRASADDDGDGRAPQPITAQRTEDKASASSEEARRKASQDAAVREALLDANGDAAFHGSSLRDVYARCCELQQCKPNSHLVRKLPTDARLTASVEELDLTSNYLGHNGVVAVLNLIEYVPHLRAVYFNDMSLDNTDIEHISKALIHHPSVEVLHLGNNPRVTLPATRDLTRLVRGNPRLKVLSLSGTKLGDAVIQRLTKEIEDRNALLGGVKHASGNN